MLAYLIIAHLVGDFLLQNHWMQAKSRNSFVCTVHVACYSLPFVAVAFWGGLAWWMLGAILVQHWLQDRFALHIRWMRFYGQTKPELWPVGPLCMDQSAHLGFIGLMCAIAKALPKSA